MRAALEEIGKEAGPVARMSEEYRSYRGLMEVQVLCTRALPRCSDKRHACFCVCSHVDKRYMCGVWASACFS